MNQMKLRGLLFGAAALLVLFPSHAAKATLMFDLTIDFVPPTPIFPTLTGSAQFFTYDTTKDSPAFFTYFSPIGIGTLMPNGSFDTALIPTDPCFAGLGAGSCGIALSFSGSSSAFDAFAFANGVALPSTAPGVAPIIPLGNFIPTEPCIPGDPCRQTGDIVAFDDAVVVGTWQFTQTNVPEPASLTLLASALIGLGFLARKCKAS
jgi:PEP-CTERM motif